jgi:RNA polymerase sigma-70 factor (ECF subfamily)
MNVLSVTVDDMNDSNEKTSTRVDPTFGRSEREYVYAIARKIVDTPEAADDVAQEAMLLAYRHRDGFRGDSRYRTWLYRIAATAALGHLRKVRRSREQLALADDALPEPIDPASSPEVLVGDREAAEVAERLLAELDPKYRDVVVLRTELTEAETAQRLGLTVANVKVRAHRARAQLRAAFEREPSERAA